MANTKDVLGDDVCCGKIVSDSLEEFVDDELGELGLRAFSSCSALTTVSLPVVTSIGNYALQNCSALTTLVVGTNNGGTVCTYNTTNSSYDPSNASLKIYVPDDLVDSYKAATNWSRLASKIYGISEYTGG